MFSAGGILRLYLGSALHVGSDHQMCAVKERNPTELRDIPSRYVEIGQLYTLNHISNYQVTEKCMQSGLVSVIS